MNLSDINLDNGLFTMLKGEPGTRKSTCALSYPKPQYWISTDQKMESLVLPMSKWGVNPKEIVFDDYNDWTGPEKKLNDFRVNCPYKTIIVDSVTSIADCMNRQTKRFKSTEGGGKKVGGMSTNSIEDYNAEASAFQDMIAVLKDIHKYHKIHVILIAHVVGQRKNDGNNNLTHHSRVIITGGDKISGKVAAYCTEAYHFNIKARFEAEQEGEYGLLTVHTGNDYARTSLPLPREITFNNEPLYDKWIAPAMLKLKTDLQKNSLTSIPSQPQKPQTTSFTTPK